MSNDIATTRNTTLANRPAHLTSTGGDAAKSISALAQYVVPPRLKIMQKSRRAPLDTAFSTGEVAVMPMAQLVAGLAESGDGGAPFQFVPLFFYVEFICTNPIEVPNLQMVRERTFDHRSELALKARNPDTRQEACPESTKHFIRNVECLNFVIAISDPESPIYNLPITVTFARGEFKTGQTLASLIRMRNVDQLYGCVFQAQAAKRKKDAFDWYGLNVTNPTLPGITPFVENPKVFEYYGGLHHKFAEDYAENILRADLGEDLVDAETPTAEAQAGGRF